MDDLFEKSAGVVRPTVGVIGSRVVGTPIGGVADRIPVPSAFPGVLVESAVGLGHGRLDARILKRVAEGIGRMPDEFGELQMLERAEGHDFGAVPRDVEEHASISRERLVERIAHLQSRVGPRHHLVPAHGVVEQIAGVNAEEVRRDVGDVFLCRTEAVGGPEVPIGDRRGRQVRGARQASRAQFVGRMFVEPAQPEAVARSPIGNLKGDSVGRRFAEKYGIARTPLDRQLVLVAVLQGAGNVAPVGQPVEIAQVHRAGRAVPRLPIHEIVVGLGEPGGLNIARRFGRHEFAPFDRHAGQTVFGDAGRGRKGLPDLEQRVAVGPFVEEKASSGIRPRRRGQAVCGEIVVVVGLVGDRTENDGFPGTDRHPAELEVVRAPPPAVPVRAPPPAVPASVFVAQAAPIHAEGLGFAVFEDHLDLLRAVDLHREHRRAHLKFEVVGIPQRNPGVKVQAQAVLPPRVGIVGVVITQVVVDRALGDHRRAVGHRAAPNRGPMGMGAAVVFEGSGAGHPLVGTGVLLEFAERQNQRHPGVRAGFAGGVEPRAGPHFDTGQAQHSDREQRQQHHQAGRDHQGEPARLRGTRGCGKGGWDKFHRHAGRDSRNH
jgi:hypothetical protein